LESKKEVEPKSRKPRAMGILVLLIVVVSVVLAAWGLATVGTSSQILPSDFVQLPTTQLSNTGDTVLFASVSDIVQKSLAVGVQGTLKTASGALVAGAKVYVTYYAQGSFRTQVATTDQNGHFEARFPVNWTGWLPVTLTYFGDDQHKGLKQVFQVAGEGP